MLFRGHRFPRLSGCRAGLAAAALLSVASLAAARSENPPSPLPEEPAGRPLQLQSTAVQRTTQIVKYRPNGAAVTGPSRRALRGPGCSQVVTSLASGYDNLDVGSEITIQAGMVEQEGFGQTYIVPDPDASTPQNEAFPITINLVEFIVATVGTISGSDGQPIRVGYTIDIYDGEPTGGAPVFSVASTNDPGNNPDLPTDIEITRLGGSTCQPCATSGLSASVVKVQFSVDSTDPGDQIVIYGFDQAGGVATGRFTVMVRLTRMNDPTPYGACSYGLANQCGPLNRCQNGFMATEANNTGALNNTTRNWLSIRECGPFACNGGVYRFSQLSSGGGISGACRPSRDTLIQTTYTPAICTVAAQGACCTPAGACSISSPAACGGAYQGNGSTCAPNPCPLPNTGACCTNGACSAVTESVCIGGGGVFQGSGSSCAAANCPAGGGACCVTVSVGTVCVPASSSECAMLSQSPGYLSVIYQGNGSACMPGPFGDVCPTGACCAPSGVCTANLNPAQCTAQAGNVYKGNGSVCSAGLCPSAAAACCIPGGLCLIRTSTQCAGFPGAVFMSGVASCSPNPCVQPGVCCRGTTCAIGITQAGCTSPAVGVGAFYATNGASGGCNIGANAVTPCCYADFDKINGVTIDDLFIYFNAYFNSSPWAKIGGDGVATPTIDDLFKYINAYFTGCQ